MIIGHQKQWQFLKKSAELNRLSHAYLFSGQEKLGKKTTACEFIKLLFDNDITKPHPDFIFLAPIEREIQINQIRDLNWRLSLKPFSAPLKTAIIDQSHLMNIQAQNCLLKTLEEPRGETLLILISEYPEFLFSTIRSRCEIIKFYPVPKKEIEDYLTSKGTEEGRVKLISKISGGKPGKAIDFLNHPRKLKEIEERMEELKGLTNSDLAFRFQSAKELVKNSNLKEILDVWLFYFRETLLSNLNKTAEAKPHFPSRSALSSFANETGSRRAFSDLKNILQKIQETNFLISTTNVNPRLALEILMLEL